MREARVATVLIACTLGVFVALRAPEVANDFVEYQEWYRIGSNAEGMLERPPVLESLFLAAMDASSSVGLSFRLFLWLVATLSLSPEVLCHPKRRSHASRPVGWGDVLFVLRLLAA